MKAGLRALELEHAIINGDRIQDPLFESYYSKYKTHILNSIEEFYEQKMLAGLMTFEQVRHKILSNVPIDAAGDEEPTIRLRQDEMDHLVRHMAAWYVRENRMTNYGRKQDTAALRSLEDIYDKLSPQEKERQKAKLHAISEVFPDMSI